MMASSSSVVGTPSRLASAPINIASLRDDAYRELTEILARIPGKILMVVDPNLIAPLKLVVAEGSKALRDFRVESLVQLSGAPLATDACDSILYLTRPAFPMVKAVAAQVRSLVRRWESGRESRKAIHLYFVPRRTFIAEQLLKDEMVHAELTLGEYGLDLLPIDDDVISLAACGGDDTYAECAVAGDFSHLFLVARALQKLQAVFGPFPHIRSKGVLARNVVDMLVRARREEEGAGGGGGGVTRGLDDASGASYGALGGGAGSELVPPSVAAVAATHSTEPRTVRLSVSRDPSGGPLPAPEIETCIVLDRSVDLVTPLVTPLTFAGLLDEVLLPPRFSTTAARGPAGAEGGGAADPNSGGISHAMAVLDYGVVFDESEEAAAAAAAATAAAAKGLKLAPRPAPPSQVTVHLNSNDKLFTEVRDTNIEAAGALLAGRAREIAALQESMRSQGGGGAPGSGGELSVADIRRMVKAIPGLQADKRSLRMCIALLERLQGETNDPRFSARWQLERGALDEENAKELGEAVTVLIAKHAPLPRTLRLLCLHSAIEGGLRARVLEGFRRELVASYGFEAVIPALAALDAGGMLTAREGGGLSAALGGGSAWGTLRRVFNLTSTSVDVANPGDIHFVTSGYAPLSVRLIQGAVSPFPGGAPPQPGSVGPGWAGWHSGAAAWDSGAVADALRLLPGPAVHVTQTIVGSGGKGAGASGPGGRVGRRPPGDGGDSDGGAEGGEEGLGGPDGEEASAGGGGAPRSERRTVLVVFIGGVTQVEIAALRFLSERTPIDYIVAATSLVSGPRLLHSFLGREPLENGMAGGGGGGRGRGASDEQAAGGGAVPATTGAGAAAAATPAGSRAQGGAGAGASAPASAALRAQAAAASAAAAKKTIGGPGAPASQPVSASSAAVAAPSASSSSGSASFFGARRTG